MSNLGKKSKKVGRQQTSLATGIVNPPPQVVIPSPPAGFVPPNAADYRGFRPKQGELAVVSDAVLELAAFRDYTSVFGMTAPPAAHVGSALDTASKWSTLLHLSTAWIDYVKAGEGMAWKDTLGLMDSLKAPFNLAAARDPSLSSRFPALSRLLGAQTVIAKRAAASRQRNAGNPAAKAAKAAKQGSAGAQAPVQTERR